MGIGFVNVLKTVCHLPLFLLLFFRLVSRTFLMTLFANEIQISRQKKKKQADDEELTVTVTPPELEKQNGSITQATNVPLQDSSHYIRQRSRSSNLTEESVLA